MEILRETKILLRHSTNPNQKKLWWDFKLKSNGKQYFVNLFTKYYIENNATADYLMCPSFKIKNIPILALTTRKNKMEQ